MGWEQRLEATITQRLAFLTSSIEYPTRPSGTLPIFGENENREGCTAEGLGTEARSHHHAATGFLDF